MASNNIPRWLLVIFAITALVGFVDASYLTAEHFRGVVPPCTTSGCEEVLTSSYAVIFGIPLAVLGMIYYGILIMLLIAYWDTGSARFLRIAAYATIGGIAASVYFMYLQAWVLNAYCQYCLLSAGTSTLLALLGLKLRRA